VPTAPSAWQQDLYELAGIRVSAKESSACQRWSVVRWRSFRWPSRTGLSVPQKPIARLYVGMDGSGVPMVKKETAGRPGKGADGQARPRSQTGLYFYPERC